MNLSKRDESPNLSREPVTKVEFIKPRTSQSQHRVKKTVTFESVPTKELVLSKSKSRKPSVDFDEQDEYISD